MTININYVKNLQFLNKDEWKDIIENSLRRIISTEVGSVIIDKCNYFCNKGFKIEITNYSSSKSIQYPHYYYQGNLNYIVIPDTPYFIEVPVLKNDLVKDIDYIIFNKLINCKELDSKLDDDICESFSEFKFQPLIVTIFHELVHCLRRLYNCDTNKLEEESTIYGIRDKTLKIDNKEITENQFRKEIKMNPRMSHNSRDICIYHNGLSNSKYSKPFLKKLFYNNYLESI